MFVTQVTCLSLPVYIHCHAQLYDNNCHEVGGRLYSVDWTRDWTVGLD